MSKNYRHIKTKEGYTKLLESGMFWEFHPELSGNWKDDETVIKESENIVGIDLKPLVAIQKRISERFRKDITGNSSKHSTKKTKTMKDAVKKLMETIAKMENVRHVTLTTKGDLIVEPKELIFVNSLGEEFYNLEDCVFYFSKKLMHVGFCKLSQVITEYRGDNGIYSEIYKTEEIATEQLNKYKESLKPIYRAFKLDEAEEYLGLKLKRKDGKQRLILDIVVDQNCLNNFFDKFTKLDGSPVGKIEE